MSCKYLQPSPPLCLSARAREKQKKEWGQEVMAAAAEVAAVPPRKGAGVWRVGGEGGRGN
jgi:hypothetical protein